MYVASTHRCATVAEPTGDASKQRRAPAAAEAPKRWCPAGPDPIVTYENRTRHDLPSFPATIKGCYDQILQITVRSGSTINMVSESTADEIGLDILVDSSYEDYLDSDQSLPFPQWDIIGLTCFTLIHSGLDLCFDGFVISDDVMNSIGVDVMVGAPFMEQNDVWIRPRRRQIMFGDECVFSYHVDGLPENVSACENDTTCTYDVLSANHANVSQENESRFTDLTNQPNQSIPCVESFLEFESEDCNHSVVFSEKGRGDESEYEDSASDLPDMCSGYCLGCDQSVESDLNTAVTDWLSISPTVCVEHDDGRRTTPFTELSSCPPCKEHSVNLPVTKVTEGSSCLSISEMECRSSPSVSEANCLSPTTEPSSVTPSIEPRSAASTATTESCSVNLANAIGDVPQVTFRVSGQCPFVLSDNHCTVESHGKNFSHSSALLITLSSASTLAELPQPDEGVLPLCHHYTIDADLPFRPPSHSSDNQPDVRAPSSDETLSRLPDHRNGGQMASNFVQSDLELDNDHMPACLHKPPPILTTQPSADDPLPATVVRCRHDHVNHPDVYAAFPYPANGHSAIYDVDDDPPQATLADDDVPCLRPSSPDVGRHTSPAWKSPPWTDGRLPPASSMERGPSPHPHDGALSAFAPVMATKRVSPAPACGIAPLGSVDVSHRFGVPWTLPPAPPDVGLTAVPHGHNPPKSPCTPG